MQDSASKLVGTGQQLLATSRQLTPQLQQLAAMAATAKQLKSNSESLKTLGAALNLPEHAQWQGAGQHEQQHAGAATDQVETPVAKGPS